MKLFKNDRAYENAHVFLWLLKDTSWCNLWEVPALIMIIPTLGVALHFLWKTRHDVHEAFHSFAVVSWIMANAIWMIGELFFNDTWRPPAQVFFGLGVASMFVYYGIYFKRHV